jgi:hypothetical protein
MNSSLNLFSRPYFRKSPGGWGSPPRQEDWYYPSSDEAIIDAPIPPVSNTVPLAPEIILSSDEENSTQQRARPQKRNNIQSQNQDNTPLLSSGNSWSIQNLHENAQVGYKFETL